MTAPQGTASGRQGTGCTPWLIAFAIAGFVCVALPAGIVVPLAIIFKSAHDRHFVRLDSMNAVWYASLYLASDIEAGRPLPDSEALFMAGLADFGREHEVGWLLSHDLGEGSVRYRPPPIGSTSQSDPCAADFLLWSDLVACEDLDGATGPLVDLINARRAKSTGTATAP